MDPKEETLGADYCEHNIMPFMESDFFTNLQNEGLRQRPIEKTSRYYKNHANDDDVAAIDETERAKTPARINPAFQNDEV